MLHNNSPTEVNKLASGIAASEIIQCVFKLCMSVIVNTVAHCSD